MRGLHRGDRGSYALQHETKAVVFDFAESRAGQHARDFLGLPGDGGWHGKLICDDYPGYKQLLTMPTQHASRVQELLPHRWQPTVTAS